MEHVTDIDKKDYIDACKVVVKTMISSEKIELTEHELTLLTEEIMDTSLMMGGDYSEQHIKEVTQQYIQSHFLPRFRRAHQGESYDL
ncbi:MAG: hypothetical protein RR585_04815 [Coprobacillus sp.]